MVWKPGESGNPDGRPRLVTELQLKALGIAEEALGILATLMDINPSIAHIQLAAAQAVLDRGLGKSSQAIALDLNLNKRLSELSDKELIELKERYETIAKRAPKLIEHDPQEVIDQLPAAKNAQ